MSTTSEDSLFASSALIYLQNIAYNSAYLLFIYRNLILGLTVSTTVLQQHIWRETVLVEREAIGIQIKVFHEN